MTHQWRPIEEVHEDYGPVILIDIEDPGCLEVTHVCDLDWDEKSEGKTHFAQLPLLTEEIAEQLIKEMKDRGMKSDG